MSALDSPINPSLALMNLREKLPARVPRTWFTNREAEIIKYEKKENNVQKFEAKKIGVNQAMVAFSKHNIKQIKNELLIGLRLEGFLLRFRYIVYQIIIVALNQSPLPAAFLILVFELLHLVAYAYYPMRYKYAKNWLLIVSKFNIGLSIVLICCIAIYITLRNWNTKNYNYVVNAPI